MPLDPSPSGQLQEFLRVLKRRRWQIVLPALFVFTLGCAFAVIVPKKFVVRTRIEIRESRTEGDYLLRNPRETATAREIQNAELHIKHYNRILTIVEEQGKHWTEFVKADAQTRAELINDIQRNIDVNVLVKERNEGSTFVDVTYGDVNPTRAELFLTELTLRWVREVHERNVNALEREREILQEQKKEARDHFNDADSEWVTHARQMRLDPSRPPGGGVGTSGFDEDPIFALLNDLRGQREETEQDLAVARSELEHVQGKLQKEPEQVLSQIEQERADNGREIADLEEQIRALVLRQERITRNHSTWRQIENEISIREEAIDRLRLEERESTLVQAWGTNPRWKTLSNRAQAKEDLIVQLGARLTTLGDQIQEYGRQVQTRVEDFSVLRALWEERERAEGELTDVDDQLRKKGSALAVMKRAYGKPYEIVRPAVARSAPTEPNPWLIVAFSLFAGLAVGLVVALVAEYGRNSYRTIHDLASVMDVPVLGTIAVIHTRAEIRRERLRRAVVSTSSAIILGGVVWLTWVWYAAPDKLPVEVLKAIESFQRMLM